MTVSIAFWVVWLIWLIIGGVTIWQSGGGIGLGGNICLILLMTLLGWHVFGSPIH